ncbi:DNA-binding CsgD family transcriptional regulator/uncharacterized coiled-coil protein SlyX [Litorivivens lipolytica]|uniref:DNA-binding CsgD family transcriptional regulator/uncharacterized coiled-coil protein SlyX n=1 Tax=Litorivivens lipolytica TaxID=1524264 RepID=A0A7W4W3K2_9GAMM|nr:helix-turn-helix transcriptional regulator [Litorivivens lipolytica]MBB3046806.1 DNA-binding CsgD family transcriptional regulator/uncharacterized coiled-coil protein SlyX [Litorivivens lipolytica]
MSRSKYQISPELDALIRAAYRGPLEETPWQSFLNDFREAVNGNYATLILRPPREGDAGVVLNAIVMSPHIFNSYNDTYFSMDPFVNLPSGEVFTVSEFVGEEEFFNSDYYREYITPSDVRHIMGADLVGPDGLTARLRITRPKARENFGEADKALCRQLLPHLEQAIELHSRILRTESERAFYEDAIDKLSMGVVILDRKAKVLRKNQAADRLLQEKRGLQQVAGTLQVGDSQENRAFRACLEEVMEAHRQFKPGFVRAFRVADSGSMTGLGLLVRPLPPIEGSDGSSNPTAAILVSDPYQPRQAPSDILIELFGFTPAESKLALRLVNGLTLDEASEELGISRNTAKSHLSSVFSKTGVARQTQLIQLILNSVATFGGDS